MSACHRCGFVGSYLPTGAELLADELAEINASMAQAGDQLAEELVALRGLLFGTDVPKSEALEAWKAATK